ncbi:hypothetical protein N9C75_03220 [Alphaproteobacteria bacterium]|nr:hypothetical protein [Alphaproteobacteria bacterium]
MTYLCEGSEPAGVLRQNLVRKWGITSQVIMRGVGDNAASA